ncbi:DUF2949 domain-containing protein [Leptolyngbya sp. 7M]|uniref:DUF2949 domain-containing protein n=1 Tax=Leptolyngbya sp. NK1-12 TaxID=2547451 RepID=A0AA97ALA4_9CYAN|nr:DUF2949 domain-containing protein [Leptolyngbya sp. 7M]MBF2047383.1 DUF2949 domain-containing protein [Elainella sp. C42_A2020_010]QYO62881.1 DUF2949 domain-containing protein [Leptolyngbya sp. 7M]RNJ70797.1 MAG: DUF2949 domain-containing protein [Leptolyngbya sp. IPPAS B-1204]WNZ24422.1 DUF2949 domain-containing protein [Leptolyngbya sp. NK1-12]
MTSNPATQARLITFLQEELAIPSSAIALALRHPESETNWLPIILWQYGLINLQQLNQVFEWMETA